MVFGVVAGRIPKILTTSNFRKEVKHMKEFKLPNPGMSLTWIIELVAKILGLILPVVTPELRRLLEKFLLDFYAKAKETPNPWDDFLAKFLLRILGIEVPE